MLKQEIGGATVLTRVGGTRTVLTAIGREVNFSGVGIELPLSKLHADLASNAFGPSNLAAAVEAIDIGRADRAGVRFTAVEPTNSARRVCRCARQAPRSTIQCIHYSS